VTKGVERELVPIRRLALDVEDSGGEKIFGREALHIISNKMAKEEGEFNRWFW
jgi:hypothetical protein